MDDSYFPIFCSVGEQTRLTGVKMLVINQFTMGQRRLTLHEFTENDLQQLDF